MRLRIAIDFSSFDRLGLAYGLYRYGVDLVRGLARNISPKSAEKEANWLQEVLR